jgi:hypothetical protein
VQWLLALIFIKAKRARCAALARVIDFERRSAIARC